MKIALAGLALLAWSAGAPRFDPPDGSWRYVTTENRSGTTYVAERRLAIHRHGTEILADITQDRVRSEGHAGVPGAMFAIGMAGLTGRTIHFHVSPEGTVTAIDDLDSLWNALCESVDEMPLGKAALGSARRTTVQSVSAPLRALPPERRQAMLASILRPLVAMPLPAEGTHPVRLPLALPTRDPMVIDARETVRHDKDGIMRIDTHAEGAPAGVPPAKLDYDLSRVIDARSGLVLDSRETVRWTTGQTTVTTVATLTLTPMVY